MFEIKNNEKNKSAVILNPERSEWVSRSHVTSVESVVNDGVKTKPHHALRRSLRALAYGSTLKMTNKVQSFLRLRGASDIVGIKNVITRRTSVRRGYLPEQGTHANKESLFASVTCFMRLPRRIQRMLLVMTIPALALLFTLITTSESLAACNLTNDNGDTVDESGNYCGTCGTNCNWVIESGTMKITGGTNGSVGHMDDWKFVKTDDGYYTTQPWYQYRKEIKSAEIYGVDNIGSHAFYAIGLNNLSMADSIKSIGSMAFQSANLASIELPSNLETIGSNAFNGNHLKTVVIPDTLKILRENAFRRNPLETIVIPDNVSIPNNSIGENGNINIICKGNADSCQKLKASLALYKYNGVNEYDRDVLYSLLSAGNINYATEQYCDGRYYWSGTSCNNKKDGIKCAENYSFDDDNKCIICDKQGYRNVDGYCNRIQYTPAEAAKVLKDDNTNEVTITFKK